MKKLIFVVALMVVSAQCFAVEPPKEIKDRYAGLLKAIRTVDTKAFDGYFDASFVDVDPSGKETKRDAYLKQISGLFKSAKSVKTNLKYVSVSKTNDLVAVGFDFHLT